MTAVWVRHTHPYGFRNGTWAEIVGVEMAEPSYLISARPCYRVRFSDGVEDLWSIYDPDEPYEFSETPSERVA